MGEIYAKYHANDWAAGRTPDEIKTEIDRLDQPRDYPWNSVGNAHMTYVRRYTLAAILKERT